MYYGMSTYVGKDEVKQFLIKHLHKGARILDVGAGGGIYQKLLGTDYEWTAVEIWHNSAQHLKTFYNYVYEEDIRDFNYPQTYDLIIFGDVLEHLSVIDAQKVLEKAVKYSNSILIAVPYNYKQDTIDGNKAEIHIQDDLTPELFDERYPGFDRIYCHSNYAYYWRENLIPKI